MRAKIQLSLHCIGQAGALTPEPVCHQHIRGGVDGLHGCDHIQLRQAGGVIGVNNLYMLDTMT
jgi:hypothetical protein